MLKPGGKFFATTFLWGVPDDLIGLSINLSGPNRRCGEGEGGCKGKSQEWALGVDVEKGRRGRGVVWVWPRVWVHLYPCPGRAARPRSPCGAALR